MVPGSEPREPQGTHNLDTRPAPFNTQTFQEIVLGLPRSVAIFHLFTSMLLSSLITLSLPPPASPKVTSQLPPCRPSKAQRLYPIGKLPIRGLSAI